MIHAYNIGVDIGGSQISGAYVDKLTGTILKESLVRREIDSNASIHDLTEQLREVFQQVILASNDLPYYGVGVAIPGPFDYERGISKISGVHKFDALFGLHFKQIIRDIVHSKDIPLSIANDASCFALGEYYQGHASGSNRTMALTLGAGFGSAFLIDGRIQTRTETGVPVDGYLYNQLFGEGIADDYFSTRWMTKAWNKMTGQEISSATVVCDLVRQNNAQALDLMDTFLENLAQFLMPWIESFKPDTLVLGGKLIKLADFIVPKLEQKLIDKGIGISILPSGLWEDASLIGSAMYIKMKGGQGFGRIELEYESIERWISDKKTVMIDGYAGVNWDLLAEKIHHGLLRKGKTVRWFFVDAAMKSSDEMSRLPHHTLSDFFHLEMLSHIQPDSSADINVVVGCGAAMVDWSCSLIYIDIPKNERKSLVLADANWKLLDDYKFEILSRIDLFIR